MEQTYNNLPAKNLSEDRGTPVPIAIEILESEGFVQGDAPLVFDVQITIISSCCKITVGYGNTDSLHAVVELDGKTWTTTLDDDYEENLPLSSDLLTKNPEEVRSQLAATKERRYQLMMETIIWVKTLLP